MADDDPRMLVAQADLIQRELQRSERQMDALQEALLETQQAANTLDALAHADGDEVLMPIGGGVHVRANLTKDSKVLLPVGAGYATEDTAEKVAAALAARVQDIQKGFQDAAKRADELARTLNAINQRLDQMQSGA